MKIFDFDLKKYGLQLIPPFLRDSVFMSYVLAFVAPLIDLYQFFLENREQNLIKLKFNYQVCSLEYRLNDAFDPLFRRITLGKAVTYKGVYLYTEAETDPNFSGYFSESLNNKMKWLKVEKPIYLRNESELYSLYDFIVKIPDSGINQIHLRAEIDFYILQTKQYKIVIT